MAVGQAACVDVLLHEHLYLSSFPYQRQLPMFWMASYCKLYAGSVPSRMRDIQKIRSDYEMVKFVDNGNLVVDNLWGVLLIGIRDHVNLYNTLRLEILYLH